MRSNIKPNTLANKLRKIARHINKHPNDILARITYNSLSGKQVYNEV